jgi:multisubunit Na+/H+ antiporter MnhG subunit
MANLINSFADKKDTVAEGYATKVTTLGAVAVAMAVVALSFFNDSNSKLAIIAVVLLIMTAGYVSIINIKN